MAILQISKIQQRSGNLVDLPQLDDAEFGWANDAKRLFIGKTTPNENIEILTSYSQISFSQLDGSVGNLNISNVTLENGQVLSYDGTNWVNKGGNAGGLLTFGDVSNVKITGGAVGYVLQTDGTGNLSWTPKGTLVADILNVTKANPAVVTTVSDNFFTDGAQVTIIDPQGMTELGGNIYYANALTSTTFALYTDSGLSTSVNSTSYNAYSYTTVSATTVSTNVITVANSSPFTIGSAVKFIGNMSTSNISNTETYYVLSKPNTTSLKIATSSDANTSNVVPLQTTAGLTAEVYQINGQAVSTIGSTVTFSPAGGSDTTIQYNELGSLQGSGQFTYDYGNSILNLTGNANVGNLNATGVVTATRLTSNIATGTAPLIVTSTTQVANLNVATSGSVVNGNSNVNIPAANGNITISAVGNANIVIVTGTGVNVAGTFNATGNANVGNLGTTTAIITTGNITTVNTGLVQNGNSNIAITANANITFTAKSNATLVISDTGANIAGTANVSGNANVGNLGTARVLATANVTAPQLISNVATGTAPLVVTSTTQVANLNAATAGAATNSAALQQNTSSATTVYPTFTTSSANGNSSAVINTSISANLANGAIVATTFVGNVSGNISGTLTAPGSNTQVIFNDDGNANATSGLTFNKSTNLLTVTGNVSGGNLTTAGALSVTGNANTGNLGTTTAIITTGNITTINTGLVQNGNSNIAITANANITFTAKSNATMVVSDTGANITGTANVSGNANVGNLGTTTLVATTGNITTINSGLLQNGTSNVVVTAAGGNVTLGVAGTARITATSTGANINGTLGVSGNANVGNLGTTTAIITTGNITTINTGLVQNGNSNIAITANANITFTAKSNATLVVSDTGANIAGTANVSGNANVGNLGTSGLIVATGNVTGGNLVTGGVVAATGNVSGANIVATSYHIRSIETGITAAGSTQGTATALTKEINVVSTVSSGANGVVLPTGVAGMVLIINNTSANTLNVYPAANAAINSGSANAAYTHLTGASIQYYATSNAQWYTVGATFA